MPVPLRKLTIEIDLPTHATTGMRAKEEHTRILKSILALVEDPGWSAFTLNLHDSLGNHAGRATLQSGTRKGQAKELPIGDCQQAAA
jgi:hypothetical protein